MVKDCTTDWTGVHDFLIGKGFNGGLPRSTLVSFHFCQVNPIIIVEIKTFLFQFQVTVVLYVSI